MAAIFDGFEYTVTGTAVSLSSILSASPQKFLSVISIRAGENNVGVIYIGKSTLTAAANRFGYLKAQESLSIDMTKAFYSTNSIYIVGSSPGDILHIMYFI